MIRRVLAFGVSIAIATGCSVLTGIDKYDDGDANDASAAEASSDAGSEASGPFCAQHATSVLCADFEAPSVTAAGWTGRGTNGSTVIRTTDDVISGTGAALMQMDNAPSNSCTYADLFTTFSQAATHAHLELKMRLDPVVASEHISFTLGHAPGNGEGCLFLFQFAGTSAQVTLQYAGNNFGGHPLKVLPKTGGWSTIVVDLADVDGASGVTMTVDDQPALTLTKVEESQLANCHVQAPIDLSVGYFCASGTDRIAFDDVAFDLE